MARPRRARLDAELVRRRFAGSRAEAQQQIAEGLVTVGGAPAAKPATQVTVADAIVVAQPSPRWASRGAHKLIGALDDLQVPVTGRYALDAGASNGGFTDVLLARGAAGVVAVDVGYGQLAWRLATDDRVTVMDRVNIRHLEPEDLADPRPDLVVADLSFISLTLVLPALVRGVVPQADHLLMVKPQFEAGAPRLGRGGVVKDPQVWRETIAGVADAAVGLGLGVAGVTVSPLPGPAGNIEFFLHLRRGADGRLDLLLPAVIERAVALGRRDGGETAGGKGTTPDSATAGQAHSSA